jgi:hypothetical protein
MKSNVGLLFDPGPREFGTVPICVSRESRYEGCPGGGWAQAGKKLEGVGKGVGNREENCGGKGCEDGPVHNVQHAAPCYKYGVDHVTEWPRISLQAHDTVLQCVDMGQLLATISELAKRACGTGCNHASVGRTRS